LIVADTKLQIFGDLSKGLSPFCLALFHFLSDTTNYDYNEILKADYFDGYETFSFEGRTIRLPLNNDAYLRQLYGDYIKPPKEIPETTHSFYANLLNKISMKDVNRRVGNGITKEF